MLTKNKLTVTILSLSLLTVMAGAAVAPALDIIRVYFYDVDTALVQMIISMPALFIALTSLVFPKIVRHFRNKTLLLIALSLYVIGGCVTGLFNNIYVVLIFRALIGVGVGIIMPMSTGLLSFYYDRDMQDQLMGYSSAMNQMGAVIATLISGFLAQISWRASFLVYGLGLLSFVLVALFLPNVSMIRKVDSDTENGLTKENNASPSFAIGAYIPYLGGIFLLMLTFFVYPSSFALETAKDGLISVSAVAIIMASMDFIAFFGGLCFVYVKKVTKEKTCFVAPAMFVAGYALLYFIGGWIGTLTGSFLIGFANGLGIPFIIASASKKFGRFAPTKILPLISVFLYLGQFATPLLLAVVNSFGFSISHVPYCLAMVTGLLFLLCSRWID